MRRALAALAALIALVSVAGAAPWRRGGGFGVPEDAGGSRSVYYIRTGDTLYVRGSISTTKDLAQKYYVSGSANSVIEFGTAFVLTKDKPYTLAGFRNGPAVAMGGDDAAPISTGHGMGYVGGNHALYIPRVNAAGHDKDINDIGSYWSDGTHEFMLAYINGNYLYFYSKPYDYAGSWGMSSTVAAGGTLTYISGAAHPTNITWTTQSSQTGSPITSSHSASFLKDGIYPIANGESGYASFVDLSESFYIMDPSTMDTTQATNPWVWNNCASNWVTVSNTYRATGGSTLIHTTYAITRPMNISYVGFIQQEPMTAAAYANRYLYVPRLKSSSEYTYRKLWNTASDLTWLAESLLVAGKWVNRSVVLWGAANDSFDLGHAMGYIPTRDAVDGNRDITSGYSCWGVSSGKIYPKLDAGVGVVASRNYDVYAYRTFFDARQYWRDKTAYWNTAAGDTDYVYVDYHDSVTNDATVLPERMWGKTVAVVDTLNVYNISATVPSTGVLVSTTATDTLGYAVLRLTP